MYFFKKSGKSIKIYRDAEHTIALNEPSRDEIAKTLVLYHEALLSQRDKAQKYERERDALGDEVKALQQRLSLLEQSNLAHSPAVRAPNPHVSHARMQNLKLSATDNPKKLGLLRALIDQNKQLRKEIQNEH